MDPGEGSERQENPGVQVQVIRGWTRVMPYRGDIHVPAVHSPRTMAKGSDRPWPTANTTGKTICGTKWHESFGKWSNETRKQLARRHNWSEMDRAHLFWVWQSWPRPGELPDKKAKPRAAAAACIQQEADMGMTGNITPADDALEGEAPLRMKMPSKSTSQSVRRTIHRLPLGKMNTCRPSITAMMKTMTLTHCFG